MLVLPDRCVGEFQLVSLSGAVFRFSHCPYLLTSLF